MATALATASPWAWEARPDVWLLMVGLGAAYWWATRRLRVRSPGPPSAPSASESTRFWSGLAVLWLAVDWPMDRLGDDFLFSAHMVQFLIITMIAVPLLVTGIPVWLQVALVGPLGPRLRRTLRAPVVFALYQCVIIATHLPLVVELYTTVSAVHFGLHVLWIVAAAAFWLPVLGSEPVVRPLSPPAKVGYLIAATILPTIPASFLTWAETPFYVSYADAPRLWGLSAVDDLQLAGLIMKLGGGTILWGYIVVLFIRWASLESKSDLPPTVLSVVPAQSGGQSGRHSR